MRAQLAIMRASWALNTWVQRPNTDSIGVAVAVLLSSNILNSVRVVLPAIPDTLVLTKTVCSSAD